MSRRRLGLAPVLIVAASAFAVGAVASLWVARHAGGGAGESGGELPVLGQVPAFSLTSSGGTAVGRDDLLGDPWVVDFIFTSCAGVCPILSTRMADFQRRLPEGWSGRLVSITVDPAHDTPEVLREYAGRYGASPERWLFLTGERDDIYRLSVEGFRLGASENPGADPAAGEEPFIHSTRMVLVDARGRIRGYYDGTEEGESERLLQDAASLSGEGGAGEGTS